MDRLVTVVAAATGAAADVRLPGGATTLADVLPELVHLTASPAADVVRDGVRLDPRQPVAHLRDGDVLVLGGEPDVEASRAVRVEVAAGPGAGGVVRLPCGRHILGRTPATFTGDPLVSRRHVEVTVADDLVTVTDLHTVNGTLVAGRRLTAGEPTPWPAATPMRIGDTVLVHGRETLAAPVVSGRDGIAVVNRGPRLHPPVEPATIVFPVPPAPTATARLPLLASFAPLAAGIALALVLRRWEFLAFAVMSPLVVLGQAASDRWSARRSDRRAAAAHTDATAAAERALAAALQTESTQRHQAAPDLGAVVTAAHARTSLLWHRGLGDDDAMTLRLGTGDVRARTRVEGDRPMPTLQDVPICVNLLRTRMLGLHGPRDGAAALARTLLVQAATFVGPGALQIHILAPGGAAQWGWARWLPHVRGDAGHGDVRLTLSAPGVTAALERLRAPSTGAHRFVIVDAVDDTALAAALAPCDNTSVLWIARAESALPPECDGTVAVAATPPRAELNVDGVGAGPIVADLVAIDTGEAVARALAPLRDAVAAAVSVPREVRWSALHDTSVMGGVDAAATTLARRWRDGPATEVCLGVTADGPCVIDLHRDGPHMLVAGTTGAGKSELLQTLVASLAAANSPADLALLLVDFKGGAAFGPCESLPHTVGVLTDLDAATTARAIDSLTAELRRRERILATAGAPDLDTWRARRGADSVALPLLVIVVDEFATLAEELPEFVGGLVAIAQRGRSLGVHLVLATQRPEGAVSADIRANMRLRVCLAVAREAESRDVIDSPEAVRISRTTPGRALVRIGAGDLVEMQTARVCAPATHGTRPRVEIVPTTIGNTSRATARTEGPTELDVIVAAACRAAELVGAQRVTPPWLPPLPVQVPLSSLPGDGSDTHVAIGLVDVPDEQSQPRLTVDAASADPLLVVGGARSGRTTAATTIATALAAQVSPDRLHIWAIDSGSGLRALLELPHTGAVIAARESERAERLLSYLTAEVARRRAEPRTDTPALLLVVDTWDGLAADGDAESARLHDLLLRLAADGPAVGLRLVVTSDRTGLSGRLAALFPERICLRLPDHGDYGLLGLPPRRVPTELPAGRGIRSGDLALVQLAVPDQPAVAAATAWPGAATAPRRFDPLPQRVPLHTLVGSRGRGLVVGVRGDDLMPVVLDPAETGGTLLVAGPPRSGRTTTLVSIAAQLRDRPVVALCARPGPLQRRRDLATVVDMSDVDAARTVIASAGDDAALLVDDVDLLDDVSVLDAIDAAVRRARDGRGLVVLAGATDAMTASFRGPVAQARRARAGVLLRPDGPHDGELLGVRLRRRPGHADPPGRGFLAVHGRVLPIQVADPD